MDICTDVTFLRQPTEFVDHNNNILVIAGTLFQEMEEHSAQGLAANQLGYRYRLRMFVMMVQNRTPICITNPLITHEKGWQESTERCLSLPGVTVRVRRPLVLKVKGFNQYWKPVKYKFTGIDARRASHEIDHLIGKLIIDYQKGET